MAGQHLKLDRDQTNAGFQSWRLSQGAAQVQQAARALPGTVHTVRQEGYDYLHTRISVLRNHLTSQGQHLYTFLQDQGALKLHRYDARSMEGRDVCHLSEGRYALQGPPLGCSLAEVQLAGSQTEAVNGEQLLMVSTGRGDLVLLRDRTCDGMGTSVHPVGTPADGVVLPVLGRQAFMIEAAYQVTPGVLRCVVWAVEDKTEQHAACVASYVITLSWDKLSEEATGRSVHLLRRSTLPPHAVVVSPDEDALAIAVDPAPERHPALGAAGLGAGAGGAAAMEEDEDAPSPRTLQAAAERLAQYTSEEVAAGEGPMSGRFADLYAEEGPDDETAATEPDCVAYWFTCRQRAEPATPSAHEGGSSPAAGALASGLGGAEEVLGSKPALVNEVSCSPYKLLITQAPAEGGHSVLMGLIDDVDVAVVSLSASPSAASEALKHVTSIPAFAWVTTGKVQRKFVLLAEPGSSVAAVIVELQKFAFVYYVVPSQSSHGLHQVLDLALSAEDSVTGAALVAYGGAGTRLIVMATKDVKTFDLP